ncbi:MaoC family dehydratase [Halobacteria archaeon AArc-curdl1]|uniref:MaoC family dehydratase n=1 Tax=Natronosalvus hydrolyticus TaxID=2979988 RepID=A0AAP2Z9L1_9EURY|nr:MaoC family dehydratase [Halobacteria archaeon AArc-curdl1]
MAPQQFGAAQFASAWSSMATSVLEGTTAANKAAVEAMFAPVRSNGKAAATAADTDESSIDTQIETDLPSIAYADLDWAFERTVDDPTDLGVGDQVTFEKTLSEDDVRAFARVSGDTNRLHLDDAFAADTRFGERIVHGTLVSGLISAALARLPGLTIYLSQDLEFRGPVGIGDRVSARVEILEDLGNDQYRLETEIRDEDDDTTVIAGEAVVLIDELPDA